MWNWRNGCCRREDQTQAALVATGLLIRLSTTDRPFSNWLAWSTPIRQMRTAFCTSPLPGLNPSAEVIFTPRSSAPRTNSSRRTLSGSGSQRWVTAASEVEKIQP